MEEVHLWSYFKMLHRLPNLYALAGSQGTNGYLGWQSLSLSYSGQLVQNFLLFLAHTREYHELYDGGRAL